MLSRIEASRGASVIMVAIQTSGPSTRPGQSMVRPWNTREAFQTMPQAKKPIEVNASEATGPSVLP